ncbi:MAG: uridine kinase [Candidatus Onthovivens sp.]|nr:uridine kinase [Mollicutes bacterium]MDD6468430.1 uridine kinase [Bacilli bacterium]MDY2724206.1 uridine kinase [Candidatus Onthovivens sp.]MCI6614653.1 uridine kinase [Mollicutes bacterium]MCI7039640.1 uridine kinase [Mollicutes bacterium]
MAKIILVGGGTASGKTYVINEVVKLIGEENVAHLSIDDYYKDLTSLTMEERIKVNYDHPKAFDWPLIKKQLIDLKNDKTILKPIYDFTIHNRSEKTVELQPKKIVIVEGIMALVNKDIRSIGDLKIFINASRERRLLRRMDRDQKERGRNVDSIINQYFATVQPMYEEIIEPSSYYADMLINNDGYDNKSIEVLAAVLRALVNGEME